VSEQSGPKAPGVPLSEDCRRAIRDVCDGLAVVYGIPPLEKLLLAGQIGEIVLIEGYAVMQACLAQTAAWTRELMDDQRREFQERLERER
jgi:hypothetical protein